MNRNIKPQRLTFFTACNKSIWLRKLTTRVFENTGTHRLGRDASQQKKFFVIPSNTFVSNTSYPQR